MWDVYTLSLHDALPIYVDLNIAPLAGGRGGSDRDAAFLLLLHPVHGGGALMNFAELVDRKSTRLNSSHVENSYAVFCLKKKVAFPRSIATAPSLFAVAM